MCISFSGRQTESTYKTSGFHFLDAISKSISYVFFLHLFFSYKLLVNQIMFFNNSLGSNRGEPRGSGVVRGGANKVLPIEIPALPLDELNKITGNFGTKALIGEGSYGRVFYGKLNDGTSTAIKKLDTSSSQDPDTDFTAQVISNTIFLVYNECRWSC